MSLSPPDWAFLAELGEQFVCVFFTVYAWLIDYFSHEHKNERENPYTYYNTQEAFINFSKEDELDTHLEWSPAKRDGTLIYLFSFDHFMYRVQCNYGCLLLYIVQHGSEIWLNQMMEK